MLIKCIVYFKVFTNRFDFNKIHFPNEINQVLQNSTGGIINTASNWLRNSLTGLLNIITSIPTIAIYFVVTIMALYLICVDKVYILDQIEHHLPKKWVFKLGTHIKELTKNTWRLFKSRSNTNINIFYNFFNRVIYIENCKIQYRISITNGTIYRIC